MNTDLIPAVLSRHRGIDVAGIDFVVIDVETTGLYPVSDRVIEVAAVRIRDGELIDEYSTLVNPGKEIRNTEHHGITTKDVDGAPTWTQITPTLLSYLSGAVMVCHNADFDHGFLSQEFYRAGIDIGVIPPLCTMVTARSQLTLRKYTLPWVVEQVTGIQPRSQHTALGDARATARLLRGFLYDAPEPLRLSAPSAPAWTGSNTAARLTGLAEQIPTEEEVGQQDKANRPVLTKQRAIDIGLASDHTPSASEPVDRRVRWTKYWRPYELHVEDCIGRFGKDACARALHRARPT